MRREVTAATALVWEIVRLGLMWLMNQQQLTESYGSVNAFYIMWLIAPSLAVIAGYLILLAQPASPRVAIVLVMSRGFQVCFGLLALFTLMLGFLPSISITGLLLIAVGDMILLVLQLSDVLRDREL